MLGTKCPSMISTWTTVPPPRLAAWTCSARWAKSADRIEGASSTNLGYRVKRRRKFYHAGKDELTAKVLDYWAFIFIS